MWKSINSLEGKKKKKKKRCIALYEITGFVGGGMNLTCNSFTSAVHIVREVRLRHIDKAHDA